MLNKISQYINKFILNLQLMLKVSVFSRDTRVKTFMPFVSGFVDDRRLHGGPCFDISWFPILALFLINKN